MLLDGESCYRAVQSRDARFDGRFITAVTSTKIYCRPSCPATTPARRNVRFYQTAAGAQQAGFRACKRCQPDAAPGSPEWNIRADLAARAMRLISDGLVDREGVPGLAVRLGYSVRHLHRSLVKEVGTGPLALARANRAQTARLLLADTQLPVAEVCFAAGFASVRQYNDTIRQIFAVTPTQLRRTSSATSGPATAQLILRLPYRAPLDYPALLAFLAARAAPGVEEVIGTTYRRTVRLPRGLGVLAASPSRQGPSLDVALYLTELRDLPTAVARCRRLFDLDADPVAVDEALGGDPFLAPMVARHPGLRSPGHVDGTEVAVRAVLGQQVSVAAARTVAGHLAARFGTPLPIPMGTLSHLFPTAEQLAGLSPAELPLPAARAVALITLASTIADGSLCLDPGGDRAEAAARLRQVPGIGAWTAGYICLRALGDPDVFLSTDLAVRQALAAASSPGVAALEQRWKPWRSYALHHLWRSRNAAASTAVPLTATDR